MVIVSAGRLPAGSLLWQPRPGAWMFTFACKATFTLRPGQCPLAPAQEPLHPVDRHVRDDPARSVHAPTDLVPIRPRADVILVGEAYAPSGPPVSSLVARLVVADIDKSIEVYGDRWFTQDGALQDGARFRRMPLVWERAAGGPDTANPLGVPARERDLDGRRPLPNYQRPGVLVATPHDVIEPIGFGPIAPAWPARRQRLGRYAAAWSDRDWIREPLPADFDATYFNVAPCDQQTQLLRDDERIVLDNLHPEHPHLVTSLSGHRPRAFVERPGRLLQGVPVRADLLWIDTARGVCTLTWRGQIPLDHPLGEGRVLIALEEPGQAMSWSDIEPLAAARPSLVDALSVSSDALRPHTPPPAAGEIGDDDAEEQRLTQIAVAPSVRPIMPFEGATPVRQPPSAPPAQRLEGTPFTVAPPPAVAPPPVAPPWIAPLASPPPPPPVTPLAMRPAPPRTFGEAALEAASSLGAAATPGAVLGASGAAAMADMPWAPLRDPPATDPASAPPVRPAAAPATGARERVELIWFDPDSLPRFRRHPPWRALLQQLDSKPLDKDLDDAAPADDPMEIEDRREVFEILARAPTTDAQGLSAALEAAERDDGKFVPPVRLLTGDLLFPFAEVETLKTTVALATPFRGNDEGLKAALANAQEVLRLPELQSAPAVTEGMTARVREAWMQGKRPVPSSYLETQAVRALLEQRSYQRRKVFGGPHVRALLQPAGSQELVPTYLPEALAELLPLYARFKARLLAELQVQVDQHETHPAALRVLALARATPSLRRR
ncbi:DUF2169 domain-containing protein [Sorangium sp. So ce429]